MFGARKEAVPPLPFNDVEGFFVDRRDSPVAGDFAKTVYGREVFAGYESSKPFPIDRFRVPGEEFDYRVFVDLRNSLMDRKGI